MVTLVAAYMGFLTVALLWYMLRQYLQGKHDLLSLRNFGLLGFIVFQVSGAIGSLLSGGGRAALMLATPDITSVIYALMVTVFIIVFLWCYEKASVSESFASRVPVTRAVPGQVMLWMLAIVLVALAAALRFGVQIPLISNVALPIGTSCAAAACGIVGWIWGPRLFNPGVIIGAAVIGVAAAAIVTTGVFGRRTLVALGAALIWGMYYSHFRYMMPRAAIRRIALVGAVPLLVVAAFTSVRSSDQHNRSAADHLYAIRQEVDLVAGLQLLAAGQDTAQNSLWLIEQYPDNFETRPLFSLYYLAVYPVPRAWWPSKPDALGQLMPHMAALGGVNRDALSLGAGVIGHAAAEGGWIALLIYAVVGGLVFRYLDAIVLHNAWSPLVVIAIGTGFGQVVGVARGETGAFAALFFIGVAGAYIIMLGLGKMLEHVTAAAVHAMPEHENDSETAYTEAGSIVAWNDSPANWHYEEESRQY